MAVLVQHATQIVFPAFCPLTDAILTSSARRKPVRDVGAGMWNLSSLVQQQTSDPETHLPGSRGRGGRRGGK